MKVLHIMVQHLFFYQKSLLFFIGTDIIVFILNYVR